MLKMAYLLTYISIIHFHLTQEKTARELNSFNSILEKNIIFVLRYFSKNYSGENKNYPRSQHTHRQEQNIVCTFCVMLLLQKEFFQSVNIVKFLSVF